MRKRGWIPTIFGFVAMLGTLAIAACVPAAMPTPTPTSKPAAAVPAPKPAAPAPPPSAQEMVKLKVGGLGVLADAGNFVAYKKGYFKEQGIDVEFVIFDSGAKQIAPLGTGELDIGRGAISAGLFNAILRGIDIKIVADANTNPPAPVAKDYAAFVIRKDLADQIKTEKDLKGRKVGNVAKGIAPERELNKVLERGGLTEADVDVQHMGMADGMAALAGKSLDAYNGLSEPFLTQALERGVVVQWKGYSEIYPNHVISVLMYSAKFIKERPEVAKRFAVAYVKGLRDYYDAFFKNKNKKEIVAILTEMTSVKDAALYDKMGPQYVNPDGYVNVQSVADDIKWFAQTKQIDKEVDVSKAVDNSFVEYAVQKLGKYQ